VGIDVTTGAALGAASAIGGRGCERAPFSEHAPAMETETSAAPSRIQRTEGDPKRGV